MDALTRIDVDAEIEKAKGLTPRPPAAEIEGRLARVRAGMEDAGLDGLFVFGSAAMNAEPIRFLSGYINVFPGASSLLIIPRENPPILLIDQAWHLPQAQDIAWVDDVRAFPVAAGAQGDALSGVLGDAMRSAGLVRGRIGIFRSAMPSIYGDALTAALPEITLAPGEPVWAHVVKTPSEYDLQMIRHTAGIADAGFQAFADAASAGASEYEVCMTALERMAALGAEFLHGSGTSTHINLGSNSEVISNVRPFLYTTRTLEPGQMFWLDLSAAYGGYYIDMDRTFAVGEPSSEQRRLYDISRAMYDAMRAKLRPGVTGHEVFEVGSAIAAEAGLANNSNLVYLGHTTGITTSIRPVINEGENLTVQAGSVVNLEPGIFVPGIGSACVEDAFLVTEDAAEPVNRFPLEIQVV